MSAHPQATLPLVPKNKRLDGSQSKSGHPGKEKITCQVQDLLHCDKYNKDLTVFIPTDLNFGFLQGKSASSMARVWEAVTSSINT
jgi:hypothetical protein